MTRARAHAQYGEERVEPAAHAVDGLRFAHLLRERAGAGGMVSQCAHQVTAGGTCRFQGCVGGVGHALRSEEGMHGG
ncbi:MAG TPA: hypothetical protein VJU59_02815 [Paraburkholderia sp.]|uniref:hypothetical protein n=1 Tax=Paraburkholderia sp. TaxID=1926495 RepID=UPI002B46AE2D|nr:hypothetical protein [Paraburkholderia sp.]HKR38602.1 hypothetical protein [Paraburkholderia sp.]